LISITQKSKQGVLAEKHGCLQAPGVGGRGRGRGRGAGAGTTIYKDSMRSNRQLENRIKWNVKLLTKQLIKGRAKITPGVTFAPRGEIKNMLMLMNP
jgi:hypothetical protein